MSTMDLGGRCIGNSYVLIEPIGGGATGAVWRGLDRTTGVHVAVKLLREELMVQPKAVTRFVQERAILLMLRHENIVRVRDMLAVGDTLGLVMDLVAGGSLREHLRRHGTLPPAAAAAVVAQLAAALAEAHELGVVHRDLKPDNVMLDEASDDPAAEPRVRLTDFGIARVLDAAGLTTPEALIGTPNYLAPEVINGATPTPALDVYALGVLLYELVTGRPPYAGGSPVTVLRRHLDCAPHRYPEIPDEVWTVIAACMDKDPARRPEAAALVVTARSLARRTAGRPAMPLPEAPPEYPGSTSLPGQWGPAAGGGAAGAGQVRRKPRNLGRHRMLAVGLTAVIAGLAGGLAGLPDWHLRDDTPSTAAQPPAPTAPPVTTPSATATAPAPTPAGLPANRQPAGAPEIIPGAAPTVATTIGIRAGVFGPLECPDEYIWDPGHPARAKPCYATGPAVRLVGRMQALPGVQADVILSLEDADTGTVAAGPFLCRGLMFTDFAPEHSCGPFDSSVLHGHRYLVVQSWRYTGRGLLPGGTARSDPFPW